MKSKMRSWLQTNQLVAYFLLAFAIAWLVWLPMVAAARGLIGIRFPVLCLWAAGLAPIGAATLLEWLARGRSGLRFLYGRFAIRGVSLGWYAIAATLPVVFQLAAVVSRSAPGDVSLDAVLPLAALAWVKGILYAPVAAFEEVGWRGFALPRLQSRFTALTSALCLGLIWAIWHLPLWWLGAFGYADLNLAWWIADVLAVSVLVTWLFNNGRGSLWLPCLFHGAANMAFQTFSTQNGTGLSPLAGIVAALLIVAIYGHVNLSRVLPRQWYSEGGMIR